MKKLLILFLLFCTTANASLVLKGQIESNGLRFGYLSGKPRLLTIGDSNTAGQGGFPPRFFAYRMDLQNEVGIGTYDLVGDFQSPSSDATYDVDNSGVGGETTAQIESRVLDDLQTYMPTYIAGDAVILNGGTNDGLLDTQGERDAARDNIEDMIDIINAYDNRIDVYVATIIPCKSDSSIHLADIASYNSSIKTMVQTYRGTKSNVYGADVYLAFINDTTGLCSGDWENQCMYAYDPNHANLTGYHVMGYVIGHVMKIKSSSVDYF